MKVKIIINLSERQYHTSGVVSRRNAKVQFVQMKKKSGRADYKQKSRKESSTPATSRSMTDELNRERKREGKSSIRPINPGLAGSTNTYARQDKGYSSTPDFFIKLFKRK